MIYCKTYIYKTWLITVLSADKCWTTKAIFPTPLFFFFFRNAFKACPPTANLSNNTRTFNPLKLDIKWKKNFTCTPRTQTFIKTYCSGTPLLRPPSKSTKRGLRRVMVLGKEFIYTEVWRDGFQKKWSLKRAVLDLGIIYCNFRPLRRNFVP